jgi:uncharacterized protein YjbI with pentapeptide repeats
VAANLAYEASLWIQAGESFYEVRMGVHTYSPFRDLRYRTIEGKCYEIELPKVAKRKDYQSLSETIQSIILIAGQNAILDTLVVKAPSLLETSDELYQATKNAFHEALPNSQTAGAHGDSLPDPLTLRDSLLRERLMAALSKGINYWNDRSRLEREFLKWEHTDLSGMTLTNIVLTCLDFGHSRFEKSNLSEANLSTIRLDQASLTDANLSKADLTAASLIHTQFLRTNLSQANLERVQAERADFT